MTSYLFIFAILTTVLNSVPANNTDLSSEEESEYNGEIVEIMKKIEKENIKSKFLNQLGRDKPPTFTKSIPQLSNDVIQKLIGSKEEEPSEEEQESQAEMFFFPVNNNFECEMKYDTSYCQRFEYRIPSDVEPSSSEFWVYKLKSWPFNNSTITVLCSYAGQATRTEEEFPNENITMQWIYFRLSAVNDIRLGQGNITCKIEVKGIVMDLHTLPFLKMMKNKQVRMRREVNNDTIKDNGCKIVPFNVSFDDPAFGFGKWIIYPRVYQANTCIGYCSHVNNHHEYLLSKLSKANRRNDTQCDNCWFTCCKPKAYKTLEIFYWEKENVITRKNLTDMIVSSCSCM